MCIHQLSKEIFNHYGRYSRNQGLSTLILNIYVVQGCQSNILCRCIRIIIGNMFIDPPSLWRTGRFTTPCHKKVLLYIILCSTLPTHKLNVHIFSHLSLLLFVSFFPCYSPSFSQLNIRLMFNFKWPYFKDHLPSLCKRIHLQQQWQHTLDALARSLTLYFIPSFLNHQNWMDCALWPNTTPTIWQIHALCVFMCVHIHMEWRVNILKKRHRIIFSYVNATVFLVHTFWQAFKCRIVNKSFTVAIFFCFIFVGPLATLENIWHTPEYECLLNVVKSIHHESRIISELGCFFFVLIIMIIITVIVVLTLLLVLSLSFFHSPFSLHICCICQCEQQKNAHEKLSVHKYTFATLLISRMLDGCSSVRESSCCVYYIHCDWQ